jgi:hypothetical protein
LDIKQTVTQKMDGRNQTGNSGTLDATTTTTTTKTTEKGEKTMVINEENQEEFDLIGITEIENYAEKTAQTLLEWRAHYDFPLQRDANGVWVSRRNDVVSWYSERGLNPKSVNGDALRHFKMAKNWENGIGWLNRTLNTLADIERFCGLSTVGVMQLLDYDSCPIEKKDGKYSVDGDTLFFWLMSNRRFSELRFDYNAGSPK